MLAKAIQPRNRVGWPLPTHHSYMKERPLHLLASPGFLTGLFLLLLNDFVLKHQFHNALTGKLSDVAGLFIFPLFWSAMFPNRKRANYLATAIGFVFWKTPYSQPLIDGWNALKFFPLARTVDPSDTAALLILPFSFISSFRYPRYAVRRPVIYGIAAVSLFAFTATSYRDVKRFDNEYRFPLAKAELIKRMNLVESAPLSNTDLSNAKTIHIVLNACTEDAWLRIREEDGQTILTLVALEWRCSSNGDPVVMRTLFENEFIKPLEKLPIARSKIVRYVTPAAADAVPTPKPH